MTLKRSEVNVDKLTKGNASLTGTGVFDMLMAAVDAHIREEHKARRITDSAYAQTYIGALQYALQAAVQYLQNADLLDAQIAEIEAKIKLTEAQTRLIEKQIEQAECDKELSKWRAVTEQAQTQKILAIGKNTVDAPTGDSNVYGNVGSSIEGARKQAWALERDAEQKLMKTLVTDIYTTIQSSEGIGANKFGLNGSNGISIINQCRRNVGMPEIDTSDASFNSESQQYRDKWAPNAITGD